MNNLDAYHEVMSKYQDDYSDDDESIRSETYEDNLSETSLPVQTNHKNKICVNKKNLSTGRNIREELKSDKYKALEELFRKHGENVHEIRSEKLLKNSPKSMTSQSYMPPPPPPPPQTLSSFAPPPPPSLSTSNNYYSKYNNYRQIHRSMKPKKLQTKQKEFKQTIDKQINQMKTGLPDFDNKINNYRDQFKAECWNVKQIIEQFNNLFDEFEKIPEKQLNKSWQLEDFLELSQKFCIAKERQSLFNQKIQEFVHTFLQSTSDNIDNIKNTDLELMKINYELSSVTLLLDDFKPGFLFVVLVCQDKVYASQIITNNSIESGYIRLNFNKHFTDISTSFRAYLKFYYRSNNCLIDKKYQDINLCKKIKTSKKGFFWKIFARKNQKNLLNMNCAVGDEINVQQSTINTINWREKIFDESNDKDNPSGFNIIGQITINCVNWTKRKFKLETYTREFPIESSVYVVHYANANMI